MSRELQHDGERTWRWDANAYPVDELTLRIRRRDGTSELREVRNTGEIELPEDESVEAIVSRGEGGREREERWRGPG